jgi:ubiquinone/menaquinone biosynthesis C-methylase UbiE
MSFYARHVLPRLIDWACGLTVVERQRQKVVPRAAGDVLEVGVGPGHNLAHYDLARVRSLTALGRDVELVEAGAERIPLPDAAVDTVVLTYTLCSIPEPVGALREMRRVLRPSGKLVFCEHGAAPDERVLRWQHRITPLWRRLAGGCHLDRDITALLATGGFALDEQQSMYLPGWRPATWNVWGVARAAP